MSALPLQGPLKDGCQGNQERCTAVGCPLFGTLGREARDGKRRVKGCGDPVARGKRNRSKGDSKARRVRKNLGLAGANTRHEEHWGGGLRIEAKAGAKANVVNTAYRNSRAQSEAARPVGDNRPFMATFSPDGVGHDLYVVRSDDMEAVVFALAEAWGFGGAA